MPNFSDFLFCFQNQDYGVIPSRTFSTEVSILNPAVRPEFQEILNYLQSEAFNNCLEKYLLDNKLFEKHETEGIRQTREVSNLDAIPADANGDTPSADDLLAYLKLLEAGTSAAPISHDSLRLAQTYFSLPESPTEKQRAMSALTAIYLLNNLCRNVSNLNPEWLIKTYISTVAKPLAHSTSDNPELRRLNAALNDTTCKSWYCAPERPTTFFFGCAGPATLAGCITGCALAKAPICPWIFCECCMYTAMYYGPSAATLLCFSELYRCCKKNDAEHKVKLEEERIAGREWPQNIKQIDETIVVPNVLNTDLLLVENPEWLNNLRVKNNNNSHFHFIRLNDLLTKYWPDLFPTQQNQILRMR